jgi:hypothetical protein
MTERDYESGYDLGTDDLPEPRYPDPSPAPAVGNCAYCGNPNKTHDPNYCGHPYTPAPAVGELTRIGLKKDGVFHCSCGASYDFSDTADRISQLEAGLRMLRDIISMTQHASKRPMMGTIDEAISHIGQLEACLAAALPYVEAANRAEHLMDGFGPRSRQSSDEHVAAIRALLKGQS